ncbi:extracellular solute-binding protein [Kaistia dalseonensis]|uniref:Raffinose/stachyose/melibiose transport system substrate-binding protein n=1 Tax=Kaistia dalseonensis TaxID=410840 RepID=A0ABU0H7B0_9HYPH|nr:extracellular solute-binding protein [Kaistia dalseonensis]MCX5494785.1 extracellular solute-binding protein [Kaistia dalseonensis]MDQ0437366.1 raffinose/stachyose/melibiose transport system substrate-binding protein [Kaistia dalseonensis]
MPIHTTRRLLLGAVAGLALSLTAMGPVFAQDPVTLSFLIDNGAQTIPVAQKLAAAFEAQNPGIKIDVESRPGGTEGDNLIKTRLATGEMTDIFLYNSGSLFQAINPQQNLVDLTDEPYEANVLDSFKKVVSSDGRVYGVPIQTAMGGGVLYNKKIYADLGLSVPKTWAEFMANNAKIKAAGKTAVIQTFKDTWTSQLFVLGDFYNVQAAEPDFAEKYTANQAKFATSPAAVKGFQHQEDVLKGGYLNADYGAATYEDGLRMLSAGEGAHYPMLTFAIAALQQNYPDNLKDIGFFALPGDDAAKNGLTAWMPAGLFIPKTSEHQEEAKKFLAFVASTAGCDIQTEAVGVTGPYLVKGCALPADAPPSVTDLLPYFEKADGNAPALEFVSPIKGPALEQITVEVGSGIRPPADGAALYDEDVRKQAQQLGLPGW